MDKRDDKVSETFFEEKARAWREEQKTILAKMESLQNAPDPYQKGIQVLELAQNAGFLFMKQSGHEKRRLLVHRQLVWQFRDYMGIYGI